MVLEKSSVKNSKFIRKMYGSLAFLSPKAISQFLVAAVSIDISCKELKFGLYAAYLLVSQVLLPGIALPFPTYNATSCYAGSFPVGPRVLYCTYRNKEI